MLFDFEICGIISDNATNNKVVIRELKKLEWPRFEGNTHWIHCFSHLLNLIVQVILKPFETQKKSTKPITPLTTCFSNGSLSEDENSKEQLKMWVFISLLKLLINLNEYQVSPNFKPFARRQQKICGKYWFKWCWSKWMWLFGWFGINFQGWSWG